MHAKDCRIMCCWLLLLELLLGLSFRCSGQTFTAPKNITGDKTTGPTFSQQFCNTGSVIHVRNAWYGDNEGEDTCELEVRLKNKTYFDEIVTRCNGRQACDNLRVDVGQEIWCTGSVFLVDTVIYVIIEYRCQILPTTEMMTTTTMTIKVITPEDSPVEPYEVTPRFGPVAGGTVVNISRQTLDGLSVDRVLLGYGLECQISSREPQTITLMTPEVGGDLADQIVPITLVYNSYTHVVTGANFTYRANPTISRIYPLKTLSVGGITQNIAGLSLDAVAKPMLLIHVVYIQFNVNDMENHNKTNRTYQGDCDVISPVLLQCWTPDLTLDPIMHQLLRQHQVNSSNRVRRRSDDDYLEFYVGMNLDGVKGYRNIIDSQDTELMQYGRMEVYSKPPEIVEMGADDVITYDPSSRGTIDFTGTNLDRGVSISDYAVEIGKGQALVTHLTAESLSILPPEVSPGPKVESHGDKLQIVANIGRNYPVHLGWMRYQTPLDAIVTGSATGAGVVIIMVIVVVIVITKRKQQQYDVQKASIDTEASVSAYGNKEVDIYIDMEPVTEIYPENKNPSPILSHHL